MYKCWILSHITSYIISNRTIQYSQVHSCKFNRSFKNVMLKFLINFSMQNTTEKYKTGYSIWETE